MKLNCNFYLNSIYIKIFNNETYKFFISILYKVYKINNLKQSILFLCKREN